MAQPKAYMNHGSWLYDCPRCKTHIDAEHDICPRCWPQANAKAFRPIPGTDLLRRVPDPELVEQVREQAQKRGELYRPVFPAERDDIEHILRYRATPHMNWVPGESIDFLIAESLQNGDDIPPKFKKAGSDGL